MQVQTIQTSPVRGPQIQLEQEEGPSFLLLPGLNDSGPRHWQSQWELLSDSARVDFGNWSQPTLHEWLPRLDRSIRESPKPVVLVAHSLGCMAVAWWAALYWSEAFNEKVAGALLVAPPDVDRVDAVEGIRDFRPLPTLPLPFPAILVASRNDPYASFERSAEMARLWGCELEDAGHLGHINADSRIGGWTKGLHLLAGLTARNPSLLVAELSLRTALA